jgi:hypothetical protein
VRKAEFQVSVGDNTTYLGNRDNHQDFASQATAVMRSRGYRLSILDMGCVVDILDERHLQQATLHREPIVEPMAINLGSELETNHFPNFILKLRILLWIIAGWHLALILSWLLLQLRHQREGR